MPTPTAVAQRLYGAMALADGQALFGLLTEDFVGTTDPLDYLPVDDERVVVLGRFWGPARDGGSAVDATFAHIITTRGDRIAGLQQRTDTARWGIGPTS